MAPDSVEREDMLLRIQEKFHPYLMKYLRMIIQGTIPGMGTRAGNESVTFLKMLAPKDKLKSRVDVSDSCKMLHLAFKGDTTEEIYDTLVVCFMSACRRFDPHYADKTRLACEAINGLPKQFTLEQLNARVPFDCSRILSSLSRKGFLTGITGKKKKVVGYKKSAWPPAKKFLESGPVGFVYVAQIWFRYFINEYIVNGMAELESGDNVLQLDGMHVANAGPRIASDIQDGALPHAEGNCVNRYGTFRFMPDLSLMETSFDISRMNLEWVAGTNDSLFKDLTVEQRTLLYLHYHQEGARSYQSPRFCPRASLPSFPAPISATRPIEQSTLLSSETTDSPPFWIGLCGDSDVYSPQGVR